MTAYLLAGGGTAGHVNPLLAVADRLREREPDAVILVLGTAEGLESRLVPARGYRLLTIERLPFPRRPGLAAVRFPARFARAVRQTRGYLREHGIDAVVGFGGYAAAPAYLAAQREGPPLVLHEANAKPGMANRLGSRLTPWVGTAFRSARLRGARFVGMPLRREVETLDREAARAEGIRHFGLDEGRPTLLVTGGSLGARRINETVSAAAPGIVGAGWQLLHLAGERAEPSPGAAGHSAGHRVVPYADRMELALAVADLAVSRAGAATVSELTALGIPAVYIPYPVGNGEQRFNAADAVAAGGAILVEDAEFTPEWVRTRLLPLLGDRAGLEAMGRAAAAIGVLDGTDRMTALIGDAVGAQPGSVGL